MNISRPLYVENTISTVKEVKKFITNENITDIINHGKQSSTVTCINNYLENNIKQLFSFNPFVSEKNFEDDINPQIPTWILAPIVCEKNLKCNNFNNSIIISLGLTYEYDSLFGIVYNPITDELFYAGRKNKGAFLNDNKIQVSSKKDCTNVLITSSNLPNKSKSLESKLTNSTGSVALDICYVSNGNLDGYIGYSITPLEYAGAIAIIQAAGGKITTTKNEKIWYRKNTNILATNGGIHDIMCDILKENEVY